MEVIFPGLINNYFNQKWVQDVFTLKLIILLQTGILLF